jgi:glyoxylase-like metal-dependent hydrolase (beta-lactamase superfamily II)
VVTRASKAIEIVRQSADALGGAVRLREVQSIAFGFEGEAFFPYQGPTPLEPGLFNYTERNIIDVAGARLRVVNGFTGEQTAFTRTIDIDGADAAMLPELARQLRQSPHAILHAWLQDPKRLALTDETNSHHVIAGAFYGELIHVYINRETKHVDRVVMPFSDVRYGDTESVIEFSEYAENSGWTAPGRFRVVDAGAEIFNLPYNDYTLELDDLEAAFAPVERSQRTQATENSETEPLERPGPDTYEHRDYGDGVRALFNSGGPDYHSLAVALDDGVIVIETPGSLDNGRRLRERASALGEVRYVSASHHHGDHAGAVAGVVIPDAALIVADNHRAFFEDAVTAPRMLHPGGHQPLTSPAIESVPPRGERAFGDRLVIYDAGPSGHVEAHLVFYAPGPRILFQSDMAVFRWDGSVEPARDQACRLRAFIEERSLAVDTIIGGHGRPGDVADLDRAIELREAPCPA